VVSLRTVKSDEQPWWLSAACARTDANAFFPELGSNGLMAKRICQRCPVARECASEALKFSDGDGVFAGVAMGKARAKRKLRAVAA
jgi:hypothetical protein